MKIYKNVIIAVMLVFGILDVMGQIDFNSCPGDVTKCNAFYSQFICNNYSVRTMYGAPKLFNYVYEDRLLNKDTAQVVKLTGTKKTVNNSKVNVDEGIEFEYIFAPNKNYFITVAASGLKNENGTNVTAKLEVIIGSQYSTQYISGCAPDVFDFQKNNGTVLFNTSINSYYPQNYTGYIQSGTANLSKVKIRCVNTNEADLPDFYPPDVNNSYALIYSVTIGEGTPPPNPGGNNCEGNDITISRDIMVDYAHQPTNTYPSIEGSFNSTTVTSRIDIKNGTYRILSNHNIYLKPPFHATLGENGNVQCVIGRCDGGEPLRVITKPNTEEAPQLLENINIYPSPSRGLVNININSSDLLNAQISVTDQSGREVYQMRNKVKSNLVQLNLEHLSNGVYFIKVNTKNKVAIKKLLISK